MNLAKILKDITTIDISAYNNIEINNLTLDSRQAKSGVLFCAVNGHNIDARKFINQTIENNVSAIIADAINNIDEIIIKNNTPIIYLTNLSSKLSKIADNFYSSPSKKTKIVGITGTNGKTTTSQLVSQWSTLLGYKSATMGTIGNGFYNNLKQATNTTGSPLEIQENIYNFVTEKADNITMEISSHGLSQYRVKDLSFYAVGFTNLTQDHLDYHKTMDNYFMAKSLLFTDFSAKYKVINVDDEAGEKLCSLIKDKDSIIAISLKNKNISTKFKNYIYAENIAYSNKGFSVDIKSNFINTTVDVNLIGEFNVYNFLTAFGLMIALGYDIKEICKTASLLSPVIGRMEVFSQQNMPSVIVDYAHTPDALQKALKALKIHTKADLWTIFGCGGDRDTGKRPLMAQEAEKNSDKIIITNDNPRTENEDIIIKDILSGLSNNKEHYIIKDRFKAIEFALKNAKTDDCILLAGKGHEDYQIIGTEKTHYSDRESVIKLLNIKDKK